MFMLIAHKRNKILLTLLLLKKLDLKCMTINDATGSNDTDGLNATSEPNDGNSPNVTSGPNEGVDEVFYGELNDADGDNSESDLVDGDNLLSDDDEEEMVAIKNKSKLVEDLGLDVVLEESVHVSIEKNEDVRGLGSGEEMDYLDSSDVCSYETDSDGGIICKKCGGTDPNGTFELMVERPTESKKPKFRRLYMRFSALKEGFKRFCRSVISLDGCYLKRSFKGEILSVVGRDGNNQNFPIAWAPVEVENKDTWAWLLQNIQNDLNLGDDSKFTLISDIQKVQTEGAQTKFAQQAATSSPSTQPMPTSPHTQPPVLSMPSRYNVTAHGPRERTITYFVACLIFLLLLTVDIVMLLMIL
ncbi:hypothetical protein V6N12_045916 [Hibiscus sabdariffa]|uniref:MULE transposase domain-containing protein n=1 Tax=Hibiscus sabdariffa TaxID=183260 RepID=A0ABR2G4L5_9ROSI